MDLEREEIRSALLKKGFTESGGDHDFYRFEHKGKIHPIGTKLSHGSKYRVYNDPLIGSMARQLGMTIRELREYVDCKFGAEELYVKLVERGKIRNTSPDNR